MFKWGQASVGLPVRFVHLVQRRRNAGEPPQRNGPPIVRQDHLSGAPPIDIMHLLIIGGSDGHYVAFQVAEVAIPRNLFADIPRLIADLRSPPNPASA